MVSFDDDDESYLSSGCTHPFDTSVWVDVENMKSGLAQNKPCPRIDRLSKQEHSNIVDKKHVLLLQKPPVFTIHKIKHIGSLIL